jgi:hypothetical protein
MRGNCKTPVLDKMFIRNTPTFVACPVQRIPGLITAFWCWSPKGEAILPIHSLEETDQIFLQMPADAERELVYNSLEELMSPDALFEYATDRNSVISVSIKPYLDRRADATEWRFPTSRCCWNSFPE